MLLLYSRHSAAVRTIGEYRRFLPNTSQLRTVTLSPHYWEYSAHLASWKLRHTPPPFAVIVETVKASPENVAVDTFHTPGFRCEQWIVHLGLQFYTPNMTARISDPRKSVILLALSRYHPTHGDGALGTVPSRAQAVCPHCGPAHAQATGVVHPATTRTCASSLSSVSSSPLSEWI